MSEPSAIVCPYSGAPMLRTHTVAGTVDRVVVGYLCLGERCRASLGVIVLQPRGQE